ALDPALPQPVEEGEERYAALVHNAILSKHNLVLVAIGARGLIVGYVLATISDPTPSMFRALPVGSLADLYVLPDVRRRGVARQLVDVAMEWFRGQGVEAVEWEVAEANHAGRAFWDSLAGRPIMIRHRMSLAENEGDR
ncbi:MAG: GNAT family N-acetyltransferase, partial [Chloroflexota bacterium]